jgi:hypothetical protein
VTQAATVSVLVNRFYSVNFRVFRGFQLPVLREFEISNLRFEIPFITPGELDINGLESSLGCVARFSLNLK